MADCLRLQTPLQTKQQTYKRNRVGLLFVPWKGNGLIGCDVLGLSLLGFAVDQIQS